MLFDTASGHFKKKNEEIGKDNEEPHLFFSIVLEVTINNILKKINKRKTPTGIYLKLNCDLAGFLINCLKEKNLKEEKINV